MNLELKIIETIESTIIIDTDEYIDTPINENDKIFKIAELINVIKSNPQKVINHFKEEEIERISTLNEVQVEPYEG